MKSCRTLKSIKMGVTEIEEKKNVENITNYESNI